jgi:hypothetical protein
VASVSSLDEIEARQRRPHSAAPPASIEDLLKRTGRP